MLAYEEYRRSRHIGGLDGLRALAIVAVIAHHVGIGGIAARGILGVSTFFAISGFLVTTILLRERDATNTISLRGFHVRRVLRIWPLYFLVLGLYTVLVAALERDTPEGTSFFENLPHFLTFTANWGVPRAVHGRVIFAFAWSLSTQEQFYLLWPSVLRFLRRTAIPVAVLVLVPVIDQVIRYSLKAGLLAEDGFAPRLFTRGVWSPICIGGLLAFAMHARRGFTIVRHVAGRPWSAPAAAVLVLLGAQSERIPVVVFYGGVVLLIGAAVMGGPEPVRRLLEWRPLVHVGKVSYGIYLLHMLNVHVARRLVPDHSPYAVLAVATLLSIAAATVSFELFESRFLALRQRLASPLPLQPRGDMSTFPEPLK